jgi:hypothetical protein
MYNCKYILHGIIDNGIDQPYEDTHPIYADSDDEAVKKAGSIIHNSETLTFNDSWLTCGARELDVITGKRYS